MAFTGPDGRDHPWRRWLTPGLLALTVGIYALLITGAVSSLADAASVCSTWPTCGASMLAPLDDSTLAVAMGHRIATMAVFGVLIAVTAIAWVVRAPRPVKLALVTVGLIYPVQIALGAVRLRMEQGAVLSSVHLLLGMVIFAGALIAWLYWLEWETRSVESSLGTKSPPVESMDRSPSQLGTARAYFQLTKPRLMWLLVVVALAGIGLAGATGAEVTIPAVAGTVLGGILAIGASGTFNHVLERDIDRRMARTADRPIPQKSVPTRNAFAFGIVLAIASVSTFIWLTNPLAAGLGLVAIAFYSLIYTVVLKPNTVQNIVIGGAVGAFPALIGWAAVTDAIGVPAIVLGVIIFLWTPAHFYNLALVYQRDYAQGGFPMLPIVRGERVTRRHIVLYAGATMLGVGVLGAVGELGWLYGATAVIAGGGFLVAIGHLFRQQTPQAAMRTFHASNAFLGVVMAVIIVETLLL